ncbi:hypothetical protein [Chitinophaga tropicalis]|uniref:Uncharacterized protein n=1 Tax=Chitinophaga tropicalis TaxID=2683588 RepID=A0A7K1TZZ6_9BACT|nr:hypothetical protein [Chitinophaga tropicalis]MVT07687.1 hypothetical protein [Chitinophaga tropicalis]
MDQHKINRDNAEDFAGLLYRKGYRDRYTISDYGGRPKQSGPLLQLLAEFLRHFEGKQLAPEKCTLETRYFNVACRFDVSYNQVNGFKVDQMTVKQEKTNEQRSYRFRHNHQLPGAATLSGLFPQPKPWERHLRGRGFR